MNEIERNLREDGTVNGPETQSSKVAIESLDLRADAPMRYLERDLNVCAARKRFHKADFECNGIRSLFVHRGLALFKLKKSNGM